MEWVEARTIVTNNKSMNYDYLAAEYTMNIYRGCSHGCIYCFARGEYYKIPDFGRVRAKKDALRIIRDDLARKVKRGIITTGGMSDPYNPEEREHKLTRNALELINAFAFGVCVLTKSDLVTRDLDILQDIKNHSPVNVSFSVTCAEDDLCRIIEPQAPTTSERLAAMAELSSQGIITGVLLDPVLPYITDDDANIRGIVRKAKQAGACYIYASLSVTMEGIQRDHFFRQAEPSFPGTAERYTKRFGNYYRCSSPREKALWAAFADECERQQIVYDMRVANRMIRNGYDLSDLQLGASKNHRHAISSPEKNGR